MLAAPDPDRKINRRDFVKATAAIIGSLMGTVLGLPALAFWISPALRSTAQETWINLGPLDAYTLGTPTLVQFAEVEQNGWERTAISYGAFVVRQDGGHVRAFSNVCTHLGCRVAWHARIANYVSPCHDGHFDILGRVVSGPPPRPLDEFTTKVEAGILYIQLPPLRRTS